VNRVHVSAWGNSLDTSTVAQNLASKVIGNPLFSQRGQKRDRR